MLSERGILHEEMLLRPRCAELEKLRSCCCGLTLLGRSAPSRRLMSAPTYGTDAPGLATGFGPGHSAAADVACGQLTGWARTAVSYANAD